MNNLKRKLRKQGGFTLIEMLIVVAIIAILIAIAIPSVGSSLDSAKKATDDANKRAAVGIAYVEYMSKGELPGGDAKDTAYYVIEDGTGSLTDTLPTTGYNQAKQGTSNLPTNQAVLKLTLNADGSITAEWVAKGT